MKLTFFLIAFCLVFLRVYYSWVGLDKKSKGEFTVTITSNNFYEQIKHGGNIVLTDDETGIKSMAPGAYFRYKKNDEKFIAGSNLEGEINYQVNDGDKVTRLDSEGKKIQIEAINEMIAYGFDADARASKIYKKEGAGALLLEADRIKNPDALGIYLKPLLADDSLSQDDVVKLIQKLSSSGPEKSKLGGLEILGKNKLKSPQTVQAYFEAIGNLGSDVDKVNIVSKYIAEDTVSTESFEGIMDVTMRLGSDMDKKRVLNLMMDKRLVIDDRFDKVLDVASHFGSDEDKRNMYKKLIETSTITEGQWISVINKAAQFGSDFDKGNMLIQIATKMPKTENIKAVYLNVAKTIHVDADYAKVIKAAE